MKVNIDTSEFKEGNKPEKAGWYMVIMRSEDPEPSHSIIQAWYNESSVNKWYVGGGYMSRRSEVLKFQNNIIGYFEMSVKVDYGIQANG